MSKHTPGPWMVKKSRGLYVTQDTGTFEDGPIVASLVNDFKYQERGQVKANAHLIAAAPEMKRELDSMDSELERSGKVIIEYGSMWHSAIRAAIAKAEGRDE